MDLAIGQANNPNSASYVKSKSTYKEQKSSNRVATPPRDPKDNTCANCNKPGHTKEDCPHPATSIEDRKCHICCKTGHIARKCPDKDKGARPGGKPALLAQSSPGTFIVPYGNCIFLGVVTDDEGFQEARRPKPRPPTKIR